LALLPKGNKPRLRAAIDKKGFSIMKSALWIIVVLMALFSPAIAGASPEIHEGQWEITVDIEMPGMPMQMPSNTFTQCVKKDDPIPHRKDPTQSCQAKDVQKKGNTYTWTMECSNPGGKMTGKGMITYEKDKMNGSMTMEGQGMKMISRYKGKRIGQCQ
jgi:hypothetical protein